MKKLIILLLAFCLFASAPVSVAATEPVSFDANVPSVWAEGYNGSIATISDDYYIMATYFDVNFRIMSEVKQIYLEDACIRITYRCTTEDGGHDTLRLVIADLNGRGYDQTVVLDGDGASHTVPLYLPAGYYDIQIGGSIAHNHTAAVNFKGLV